MIYDDICIYVYIDEIISSIKNLRYCVIGTLENEACNLPHPAHFQSCESPIPPSHHTARCDWKKASALHGEWDTAGRQLAEDTLYLRSFIGCCKLTIRLNYFQQSSEHASLALAWRNLLQDQRTEGQTTSKHVWKEAQNHWQADNQFAESVWHWNSTSPFSPLSCLPVQELKFLTLYLAESLKVHPLHPSI